MGCDFYRDDESENERKVYERWRELVKMKASTFTVKELSVLLADDLRLEADEVAKIYRRVKR